MNQRKKELEANELADAVSTNLDKIKPHLPKIAMFSGVGILAVIAVVFWMSTRRTVKETQWKEFVNASRIGDSRGDKTVAELFPNTKAGFFATIRGADKDAYVGARSLIANRENHRNQLKQAIDSYERVIGSSRAGDFEKARATYALGYCYESLGKFEDARQMYQALADKEGTAIAGLATKALNRINNPEVTSIYEAFEAWAPNVDDVAPGARTEGGLSTGSSLKPRPDISMPVEMDQPSPGFDEASDGNDESN